MRGRGASVVNSLLRQHLRASSTAFFGPCEGRASTTIRDFSCGSPVGREDRNVQGLGNLRADGRVSRIVAGVFPASVAIAGAFATLSFASSAVAKERVAVDHMPKEVVLYQYEACPFCNKVKAFLDYRDIPYQVVEVNPVGKKELKWSEYKKVPVVVVDGEQLNDSTAIITSLNDRLGGPSMSEEQLNEEDEWRRWVDEYLVHLLSPNIYRTPREALEAFDYIAENGNFSAMERVTAKYFGAAAMYFISKRLKERHKIHNPRASLFAAAETWMKALGDRRFLGGDKPNLADLAVFGVLRPIRHLRAGEEMMTHTSIGSWYANMEEAVGLSSRVSSNQQKIELTKTVESTVTS